MGWMPCVAQRQQAAVHHRVQGFHPAVHHFGKAGHVGHIAHGQARVAQPRRRAPGRDQFDTARGKAPGEIGQPGLV
jgi:hypothetical protein